MNAQTDPHRPMYHFVPGHWMNDSVPFFWDGAYHFFFLHHTEEVKWSSHTNWGHAASRDLVHWERLPDAIKPSPGGPDGDGCWTGSVVAYPGGFSLFYTAIPNFGAGPQLQCLAESSDLIHWDKSSGNPLGVEKPAGFGDCFRDPFVGREGAYWYMLVGGEQPNRAGGTAFLYRSADRRAWEYQHPFAMCETAKTGHECECPDFFALGDRHVFLSSSGQTWWQVGTYDDHRFTPQSFGPTDRPGFYAAKTLLDDRNRRILLGWIQERRPEAEQQAAGWSGVLSLPRVLSLRSDNTLGIDPAPELSALRGAHKRFENLPLSDQTLMLDGVEGDALEVIIQFAPTDAPEIGASVRCTSDGEEGVEIAYDAQPQRLGDVPLALADGEGLTLRIFIDRSVIEAFANGRACHTRRTYPERADCLHVALFARGGNAVVKSVDVWQMQP